MANFNIKNIFKPEGRGELSIDIGTGSVKFVLTDKGRVIDYGLREIADVTDVAGVIRELLRDIKPSKVYTFVSGPAVSMRQAPFPKMSRKELRDSILLRLDRYSPFSLDEAILDFHPLGVVMEAGAPRDNVMVIAARKDVISDHISTVKKVGLEPTAISVVPFALAGAVRQFVKPRREEVICVLDIGSEFTDIVFMRGENIELARTVTVAGKSITEAMTISIATEEGQLSLTAEEAERYKREYGIPPEDSEDRLPSGIKVKRLLAVQRSALERLLAELDRSIDFYKREFSVPTISRILLCGGGAKMRGMKEYIEANLKIPTEVFDPFKAYHLYKPGTKPEEEIGCRLVACLGLHFDHRAINLLPTELKAKRYQKRDIALVMGMAVIAIPIFILIYLFLTTQEVVDKGKLRRVEKELKEEERIAQEHLNLSKRIADLEAEGKLLRSIVGEKELTVPFLKYISKVVPANIQLTNLTFTGLRTVKIKGIVTGLPEFQEIDLAGFMVNLELGKEIKAVKLVNKAKTILGGEQVLEFELDCEKE
ncbi:MAG: type IV pilus assembly protein PilM [candidate division WOR-3 bacterium]